MGGQKLKFWAEILMVDARIPYVVAIKISIFFNLKKIIMCHLKSSTYKMCMADFQAWFWPWWWGFKFTKSSF
jgi:hypothetical protein